MRRQRSKRLWSCCFFQVSTSLRKEGVRQSPLQLTPTHTCLLCATTRNCMRLKESLQYSAMVLFPALGDAVQAVLSATKPLLPSGSTISRARLALDAAFMLWMRGRTRASGQPLLQDTREMEHLDLAEDSCIRILLSLPELVFLNPRKEVLLSLRRTEISPDLLLLRSECSWDQLAIDRASLQVCLQLCI